MTSPPEEPVHYRLDRDIGTTKIDKGIFTREKFRFRNAATFAVTFYIFQSLLRGGGKSRIAAIQELEAVQREAVKSPSLQLAPRQYSVPRRMRGHRFRAPFPQEERIRFRLFGLP